MIIVDDAADPEGRVRWFRAALAISFLGTLALSQPLWLADRRVPLVPVFDGLPQPGHWGGLALFWSMAAALLVLTFSPRSEPLLIKWAASVVLVIGIVWALLDQMRLQPYFITFMLATACLVVREMRVTANTAYRLSALAPFQLAIAATYVWAGTHKLNSEYLYHGGIWLLAPVLRRINFSVPTSLITLTALGTALFETALGLALLWPRTRRVAVVGLTGMHFGIIARIGPFGAPANTVVWPWNFFMVASLWLLFWPRDMGALLDSSLRSLRSRSPWPVRIVWLAASILFVLGPALNYVNAWDDLMSFQLYSAKERHVGILYAPEHREELEKFGVLRAERVPGRANLARWSGMELNATPLLASRALERIGSELARGAPQANVRLQIASRPALLTGERRFMVWAFPGPDYRKQDITASSRIEYQDIHVPIKPAVKRRD